MPVTIIGLAHIGIRVHDLARSVAFYELLGFGKPFVPPSPDPVAILHHPSGVEINLIINARVATEANVLMDVPTKHPGITHIALRVPDLDSAQATLEAAGISLSGGPVQFTPTQRGFFVRDPDGTVIELHQHT